MALAVLQPSSMTVMIKPVGALCNLDCTYCYYLPTKAIYSGHERRMSLDTLESIFASLLPRAADHVTVAWQGGEPMLAGLPFFHKAFEFQEKYARPGQRVVHALQTNGTLLDEPWCEFLKQKQFLVGLSVDGPPRFHDHYRLTNRGQASSDLTLRGLRLMQKVGVEYNILCVLNDVNVDHPEEVYGYLLNLGSRWLQFIPAVEWVKNPADPARNVLAPYSPDPQAYGRFLCRVFDLWFAKHRQTVSLRLVDAVLNKLVLGITPFCILDASCHNQVTIEHDGAVFGCDHFVERRWQLATIGQPDWVNRIRLDGSEDVGLTVHGSGYEKSPQHAGRDIESAADVMTAGQDVQNVDSQWFTRVDGQRLGAFAGRKQHLPQTCKTCQYKAFCHGGCPKHRSLGGEAPEPTVLCEAYKMFFGHAMQRLEWMAGYLRQNRMPPSVGEPGEPDCGGESGRDRTLGRGKRPISGRTPIGAARPGGATGRPGRNDPCPCGSGLKYKKCHGAAH